MLRENMLKHTDSVACASSC